MRLTTKTLIINSGCNPHTLTSVREMKNRSSLSSAAWIPSPDFWVKIFFSLICSEGFIFYFSPKGYYLMHPFPFALGHLWSLIVLFMLQISFNGFWLGGSQSLISDFGWFPLFTNTKYWNSWDTLKSTQAPTIQVSFLLSRTSALWSCYFKRLTLHKAYPWQVHISGKSCASVSWKMLPS